jgi:hypothetical protein
LHNDDIAKHPARPIPNDLQRLYREAKKELKAAGDRTRTPTNEQNDTEIREPIPTTNTEK